MVSLPHLRPPSSSRASLRAAARALGGALLLCAAACGSSDSGADKGNTGDPPADNRVLAFEVNQPFGADHGAAISNVEDIGAHGIQLTLPWSFLEPSEGTRDLSLLQVGLQFYRDRGLTVVLSIPTVDTVSLLLPEDLRSRIEAGTLTLDDPEVLGRYEAFLDAVLPLMGDEVRYLVMANEVDIHMSSRPQAYRDAFTGFFAAGLARVRAARPDIGAGLSVTYNGMADAPLQEVARTGDAVFLTYYRAGNFGGPVEGAFADHLAQMADYAGDRPLVMKELGYATGEALGGSEEGQAAFWGEVFGAWDEQRDRVPLLMVSRLYDGARSDCESTAYAYGLPDDEAFIQFLCTLGVKHLDSTPKPAWDAIAQAAAARGF